MGFNRWGSSGISSRETTKLEGVWAPGTNATGFVELEPRGSKFTGPRKNVQVSLVWLLPLPRDVSLYDLITCIPVTLIMILELMLILCYISF